MSYTARDYLSNLNHFKHFPSTKEEAWRFSRLNPWLDKVYGAKTTHTQSQIQFINTQNYISIHNGQVTDYEVGKWIKIETMKSDLNSEINPYLGLINDITPLSIELTCTKTNDEPLLINYTYDNNYITASSIEIHVKDGVDIEIVEYFEGADDSFVLHSSKIVLDKKASLSLKSIQNLENSASFITHTKQSLAEMSNLKEFYLFQGSGFHQHFIESNLYKGSNKTLNALMNSKSSQNHLLSTLFTHIEKDTTSLQKAKELLNDNSMALYDARSVILKEATSSDVRQENRGLIMSAGAHLYAKPHLEIFTDDLQASHGATVGELDDEALNYLQTRGIPEQQARIMLINAFIDDILITLDNDELLGAVEKLLNKGSHHENI